MYSLLSLVNSDWAVKYSGPCSDFVTKAHFSDLGTRVVVYIVVQSFLTSRSSPVTDSPGAIGVGPQESGDEKATGDARR